MTGREFLFFMIGVLFCNMLRAFREPSPVDGAKPGPAAEERERLNAPQGRPLVQVPIWPFCLLGAGWLAMVEFYALDRLLFWNDRWDSGLYLVIGGLAVGAAMLGLIGLAIRDEGLPRRMGRRWGALFAMAPVKPKPARHDLE